MIYEQKKRLSREANPQFYLGWKEHSNNLFPRLIYHALGIFEFQTCVCVKKYSMSQYAVQLCAVLRSREYKKGLNRIKN